MILVVGATGTTGRAVVRELLARGAPVRGLTRSEERASELRALGAEAAVGDLGDPLSLMRALRGVDRMYLASPIGERLAELEQNAVAAAEQAGAYHVVKLGLLGQSPSSPLRIARVHAEATDALQGSSLRWTVLMPSAFMQDLLARPPLADAPVAYVDARDVAAVAARALSEEGHENCSYALTGPQALSAGDVAATLAEAAGAPVDRADVEDPAAELRRAGVPDWTAEGIVELWRDGYGRGLASSVTPDAEATLGRPPTPLRRFAEDHREALSG